MTSGAVAAAASVLLTAVACDTPPAIPEADVPEQSAVPPARDGNIAIEQEFRVAMDTRTREALALFIARHPDHPLATKAKAAMSDLPE